MIQTFQKNIFEVEISTLVEYSTQIKIFMEKSLFWTQTSFLQGFFILVNMAQNDLKNGSR